MPSFDVVSQVDRQEIDNAVNQTRKEISQRYDFKGTKTTVDIDKDSLHVVSDDDFKVKAVVDVLQSKFVRRGISLKALVYGKIEPAAGGLAKQTITVQQGIDADHARQIVKLVKDTKLKVQTQIQGDQLRISAKKRDDLQQVIQLLKAQDLDLPLQFVNFRE
ncbi:MAG TPA: YajQ family cyclic di-GMP-binding protein [Candidatus Margulisiibacteriota bacterium]|nr:YajQ family cyclic di-GMP-binding protein [Candidatus Margulisiibacteriota bacterium]